MGYRESNKPNIQKTKMKKRREVTNLGVLQLNMNINEGNDGQDGEGRRLRGEQR